MNSSFIIPAINAQTKEGAEQYIKTALPFSQFFHIDVADGKFTTHATWGNPTELRELIVKNDWNNLAFEIHLMVDEPESQILSWRIPQVKRAIVHAEAIKAQESILDQSARKTPTIMIALNPESPISLLDPYLINIEEFQLLGVVPGKAGQVFNPVVINKVSELREKAPNATIEVDGGINPKNARLCRYAGANLFVAASYIFKNQNPTTAYEKLQQSITV